MAKKYDVVATIGTYQKDGETKYINRNVGAVIETQNGFSLKLDASFNPAGCKIDDDGRIWLKLFEPRQQNQPTQQQQSQHPNQTGGVAAPADDFDDIPFLDPYRFIWNMV